MRGHTAALVVLAAAVFSADVSDAQERRGILGFERNDRVFTWRTVNNGDFSFSDKLGISLANVLTTSLNQRSGSDVRDRWYDKIYNQARLHYDVTDRFNLSFLANEDWNKDTMNAFGKSLLTTNYGGLLRYTRSKDFWIEGGLEHTYDTRFDYKDKGSTAKTKLRYSGTPLRSDRKLQAQLDVDAGKSNLKRNNDRLSFGGGITYEHDMADFSMKLNNRQTWRGYLSDIDRKKAGGDDEDKRKIGVEERKQLNRNIELTLSRGDPYSYRKKTAFAVNWKIGRAKTEDSANEKEGSSKYHNNSNLSLRNFNLRISQRLSNRISAAWEAGYRKDTKDVQNKIRSRNQTDIVTRGDLVFALGVSDSLTAFGWIKRTRIDTPEGVSNDRDELKFETGVQYNHRFSNNFQIAFDFRVLETHYVNIDVSQSSQNKWMKTYLLSPSVVYIPAPFLSVRHGVNIYANYIEYDFESPVLLRSNITRRFSSETWIDAEISSRTRARLGFMIEENDYGKLNMKRAKIPVEEGEKRFCDMSVEYKFSEWMILTPRYVYSIRKDWNDTGIGLDLYRREIDQTYGIECNLFKNRMNDYDFVIGIKRIVRKTRNRPPRIRNYVNMTLRYEF